MLLEQREPWLEKQIDQRFAQLIQDGFTPGLTYDGVLNMPYVIWLAVALACDDTLAEVKARNEKGGRS